jgi:hypothetical protein
MRLMVSGQRKDFFLLFIQAVASSEGGNKEPVALEDGFREIELSWTVLLLDLKGCGLSIGLRLAVGDGALGFGS